MSNIKYFMWYRPILAWAEWFSLQNCVAGVKLHHFIYQNDEIYIVCPQWGSHNSGNQFDM
jgi:hypothetical protein